MSESALKPPGKSTEIELVEFVKGRVYRENPLYADDVSRWRRAELYDQNDQVLQRAYGAGSSQASQWVRLRQDSTNRNAVYLPTYNEGVTARENESARLGRPEYKPRVRAKGQSPSLKAKEGAKGAERALISRLKDMRWDVQADRAFWQMPSYGGTWLLSYWDQTWMETVRVPAPSLACPRYGAVSQSSPVELPSPPPGMAGLMGESEPAEDPFGPASLIGPAPGSVTTATCSFVVREDQHQGEKVCPHCPDHPALKEYKPTLKEAQGPLGKDLPKGDWVLKAADPYGMFVRDCGVGVDPTKVDEFVYAHIETLDWVAERWPDKVRDKNGLERIKGASVAELLSRNPTLGSPMMLASIRTVGAFKQHVLVMEYHKHATFCWSEEAERFERDKGRSIVVVNESAVLDGDLEIPSLNKPGVHVPRVEAEFVAWELMDGGRRGTVGSGLWDRMFDAQDGINVRKGQVRAVNERGALPIVLTNRSANLEEPANGLALPYRQLSYETDPGDNRAPVQVINNETIAPGVHQEINDDREYLTRVSGAVEVERGQVPTGVGAATSIAYLKTEAGEKRRPRIKRFREALVRKWQHGLELMAALYIEPRPYQYQDDTGEEREAFITGDVIASANPKVDIYPAPDYDAKDLQRENVRDAIQLGALDPKATSRINRKVLALIDDSLELFASDDLQEEQAQREWQYFQDKGRTPIVDPGIDDDATHIEEHGRCVLSPWFRDHEDRCNWDGALLILGNQWDETLQQIGMASQGMAPQPLIQQTWDAKLKLNKFQSPDPEALNVVLSWRAHYEAHRLRVIMSQVQEQATTEAPAQGSAPAPGNEQAQPMPGGMVA